MNENRRRITWLLVFGMVLSVLCIQPAVAEDEEGGNNLSLPVIWADDVNKPLRGEPGVGNETTGGDLWLLWYEADVEIVCHPIEVEAVFVCNCEIPNPHVIPPEAIPVYPQRDPINTWQADSLLLDPNVEGTPEVDVTYVDWGDNLEAKDWYYRSIIRTETILYKDLSPETPPFVPMTGYEMIWLEGLGVGEVWGSTLNTYESDEATVYTGCARLTIQEFSEGVVPYETVTLQVLDEYGNPVPVLGSNGEQKVDPNTGLPMWEEYDARLPIPSSDLGLTWNATTSVWEGVNMFDTHFNSVVWDATGSQDYEVYSAEINVKGKVIYGYNWNTRELSGGGDKYYRITFSMDNSDPNILLNTVFSDDTEVLLTEEDPDGGDETNNTTGGGIAVIDSVNNLSYIDVLLLPKKGGGDGGNKPEK